MATRGARTVLGQLEQHRRRNELIAIRREPLDPFSMCAFVRALGHELILLQYVYDLSPDGFKIVRLCDISRIERRETEKWCQHIMEDEKAVSDRVPPFRVDLASWKSAIDSIRRHGRNVIVEDEDPDDELFVLGQVTRLRARELSMRPIEPTGEWALDEVTIPYSRITAVGFDDRYSKLFGKYARAPGRAPRERRRISTRGSR